MQSGENHRRYGGTRFSPSNTHDKLVLFPAVFDQLKGVHQMPFLFMVPMATRHAFLMQVEVGALPSLSFCGVNLCRTGAIAP